jgi:hypothetical protein
VDALTLQPAQRVPRPESAERVNGPHLALLRHRCTER